MRRQAKLGSYAGALAPAVTHARRQRRLLGMKSVLCRRVRIPRLPFFSLGLACLGLPLSSNGLAQAITNLDYRLRLRRPPQGRRECRHAYRSGRHTSNRLGTPMAGGQAGPVSEGSHGAQSDTDGRVGDVRRSPDQWTRWKKLSGSADLGSRPRLLDQRDHLPAFSESLPLDRQLSGEPMQVVLSSRDNWRAGHSPSCSDRSAR